MESKKQNKQIRINQDKRKSKKETSKKETNDWHPPSTLKKVNENPFSLSSNEVTQLQTILGNKGVLQLTRFPREARRYNPYSRPPKPPASRHRMSMRVERDIDTDNTPVYSGHNLWKGTRTGAYPTRFDPDIRDSFIADHKGDDGTLYCPSCEDYFDESEIQVDHKIPIFEYIARNADPDGEEEIDGVMWYGYKSTRIFELYNDTDNLQILCASCNSSKGGARNPGGYEPTTTPYHR